MTTLAYLGELGYDMSNSAWNLTDQDPRIDVNPTGENDIYSRVTGDLEAGVGEMARLNLLQPTPSNGQLWLHFHLKGDTTTNLSESLKFRDDDDLPVCGFGKRFDAHTQMDEFIMYLYDDDGAGHTAVYQVESQAAIYDDAFDLCWDYDKDILSIYRNEQLVFDHHMETTIRLSRPDMTYLSLASADLDQSFRWSQVIVADEPTLGWRAVTLTPTGTPDPLSWSGDVSDVATTSLDVSSGLTSSVGGTTTFNWVGLQETHKDGMEIDSVFMHSVADTDDLLPNIQHVVSDGTDTYDQQSNVRVGDNYATPVVDRIDVNPSTGKAWEFTDIDTLEFGIKGS